jgi:hypothetical protein
VFRLEKLASTLKYEMLLSESAYQEVKDLAVCQPLEQKYGVEGFEGHHALFSFEGLLEPKATENRAA